MKKGLFSVVFASALLGATSYAIAGAYGEAEQAEEIPPPAPAAVPAAEEAVPRVYHKFSGFLTDAETTRGFWAEIDAMYGIHYYDHVGDAEAVNTALHLSYGQEMWEVGALMPYIWAKQSLKHLPDAEDDAFGDLRLWGKFLPVRTDMFTFGLGLIASFPTASDNFGTDAYGFEPFLTAGVLAGPVHFRYHAGYYVTTDPHTNRPLSDDAFDNFDQNLGVLWPATDDIVVRAEITHSHFVDSHEDPTSIIPGVDFYVPVGGNDLVLRPTVGVGLCDNAPNWQAGLGIAFNVRGI
jgi:hypothetical protein